ncbi:MAG TPA: META domain-containing protein [Rubrivivax sp.]
MLVWSLPAILSVVACAAPPSPVRSLALTSWELVRFQSMDDAQGTTHVEDPSLYTISFGADGRVSLRANCNRGAGSWQATPAADGRSGSLDFGALAATRALCPPPSLDEKLLRDMAFVRGYLLRDGQLHLSLMADAGIYSWRPLRGQ